jgi:ABC-type Fe3+/spermidine/putrescine transport system ATPase subunit
VSASAPLLELRAVSHTYGPRSVLRNLDLTMREGEHTAVLGSSGSGKSTLLRIIAGLELPTSGDVFVAGAHASSSRRIFVPAHARHLSMVFQDLALWPSVSVLENVVLGLDGQRLSRLERGSRAQTALDLCRVGQLAGRRPGSLSGGEQQRVALARAIAVEPALLLLDEPFAGLDLSTKSRLLIDLRELAEKRGMTLCLVTHDPSEALSLCTHAVVLDGERIVERGPWCDVLLEPRSDLLRTFRKAARVLSAASLSRATP